MKQFRTLCLLFIFAFIGCNEANNRRYLPGSIGAINSVTVVIENDLWKGEVGDKIREHFASPAIGLTWDEPIFTLNQAPKKVFTGAIRNTRSIIYVALDTLNVAGIKTDMYATPQRVAVLKGGTEQELMKNISDKAQGIIASFQEFHISDQVY